MSALCRKPRGQGQACSNIRFTGNTAMLPWPRESKVKLPHVGARWTCTQTMFVLAISFGLRESRGRWGDDTWMQLQSKSLWLLEMCARALPPRKCGNWICSFLPWILYVPGVFGRLSGAKATSDSALSKNAVFLRYSFVSTYPEFRGMLISGNKVSSLEDPEAMGKGYFLGPGQY